MQLVRWIRMFVVAVLVGTVPSWAWAQTSAAEALYLEGFEAMEAKDYETACAKFEASFKVANTTGPLQGLAKCEEARGNPARSLALWRDAKQRLPADSPSLPDVKASIARLDAIVAKVTFKLADGAPSALQVRLNGQAVVLDGGEQLLDPDEDHKLKVSAAGFADHLEVLRFEKGEHRTIDVAPGAATTSTPAPSPSPGTADAGSDTDGDNTLMTVGFIVGGVGLAAAAVGIATGVIMLGAASDVDAACGADRNQCADPVAAAEAKMRGDDLGVLNAVTLGVGVAGVAAGLVMVLWNVGDDTTESALGFHIRPGLNGLMLDGRF